MGVHMNWAKKGKTYDSSTTARENSAWIILIGQIQHLYFLCSRDSRVRKSQRLKLSLRISPVIQKDGVRSFEGFAGDLQMNKKMPQPCQCLCKMVPEPEPAPAALQAYIIPYPFVPLPRTAYIRVCSSQRNRARSYLFVWPQRGLNFSTLCVLCHRPKQYYILQLVRFPSPTLRIQFRFPTRLCTRATF